MKHVPAGERTPRPIQVEGAAGVQKAGLITAADGSPTVAMRHFIIEPGGNTPYHTHDWEHVVYVVSGGGLARSPEGEARIGGGDALLVDPDIEHNFVNDGDAPLHFLCIVPLRGDG